MSHHASGEGVKLGVKEVSLGDARGGLEEGSDSDVVSIPVRVGSEGQDILISCPARFLLIPLKVSAISDVTERIFFSEVVP